jgi:hypothetical protein
MESGSACSHGLSARDTIMIRNFRHKGLQSGSARCAFDGEDVILVDYCDYH